MTSYTQHEIFADKANDYLDKHNIYELFGSMLKDLAMNRPKDALSHMISLLERPSETLRLLVFGAPGSGVDNATKQLTRAFGLVHIQIEQLMQSEVDNKTSLGAKVKDCRDNNLVISDELMTTIVKSRLSKSDCLNKGWLLDGYPATASQASSLQLAGVLSNKVVVLDEPIKASKAKAKASGLYDDLPIEDFEALFADYERHIKQILPLYPDQSKRFVDAAQDEMGVWANIESFVAQRAPSLAPRRPMRVCMLGPTGAGKQTQCTKMAHTYGLVHLSTGHLLRKEMSKNLELEDEYKDVMTTGALLPDDVVSEIVIKRLLQSDCRARGWLLDGFPRTPAQAKALEKASLIPNRAVFLDVDMETSKDRCESRRLDPDTLNYYDLRNQTSPSPAVAQRLVTQSKDVPGALTASLVSYNQYKHELQDMYKSVSTTINGSQAQDVVFEEIQNFYLVSLGARKFIAK